MNRQLQELMRLTAFSPAPHVHGLGNPYYPVPPHKSLCGKYNERGLPIVNPDQPVLG